MLFSVPNWFSSYQIFVNQLYTSIKLRTNLKLKKFKVLMKDSSYGNLFHYTCNNMQLKIIICTTKHLLGMHLCIFLQESNTVFNKMQSFLSFALHYKAATVYNHGQPILNLDWQEVASLACTDISFSFLQCYDKHLLIFNISCKLSSNNILFPKLSVNLWQTSTNN